MQNMYKKYNNHYVFSQATFSLLLLWGHWRSSADVKNFAKYAKSSNFHFKSLVFRIRAIATINKNHYDVSQATFGLLLLWGHWRSSADVKNIAKYAKSSNFHLKLLVFPIRAIATINKIHYDVSQATFSLL